VLLAIFLQASDIRISEVMSNPQGSEYENEFIEVYNHSDHVTHINGWLLSDGNGVDSISHIAGSPEIRPGGYAVIFDPGYNFSNGPYSDLLPDSVPVYSISTDASFGSGGLANTAETVMIWSPDSIHTTQMSWSSASGNGYSWERVSLDVPDSQAIWQQSLVENGTPGFRNSVQPAQINLRLKGIVVTHSTVGEPVELMLSLENAGTNAISNYSVSIYHDENQDEVQGSEEWALSVEQNLPLVSQQILECPITIFPLEPGVHWGEARLTVSGDQFAGDDSLRFQLRGAFPKDVVSLTEIMFSPSQGQGGEWIEIKNISSGPISLQGWTLADANQTRHNITNQLFVLEADCLLTLCADQDIIEFYELVYEETLLLDSWPTLNASSDSVRLFDATDHAVASAYYRGNWGASGKSLERKHPLIYPMEESNWAACLIPEGGTPSRTNTQQLKTFAAGISTVEIMNQPSTGPAQLSIFLSFKNQGLDTLFSLELESDADIQWHGELASFEMDSLIFNSPIMWPGYSTLAIRLLHQGQLLADTLIQVILGYPAHSIALNEIHYLPGEDQVEFLEFINTGSEILNLHGWKFMDRSGTLGSIVEESNVAPGEFFLICPNAATLTDWCTTNTTIIDLSPWPSLNNSSDSIFIQDPVGNLHISHGYDAPSGSEVGKSLERLALWKAANLAESWGICQDPVGITPGRQNSVLLSPSNLALEYIQIPDSTLWIAETLMAEFIIINTGANQILDAELSLRTFRGNVQLHEELAFLPPIYSEDTLVWRTELVTDTPGWVELRAELIASQDETVEDNRIDQRFYVSNHTSPLIINEIYPLPLFEQFEWVEIYNRSNTEMDIQGWSIADNAGAPKLISDSSLVIDPNTYLLLSGQVETISWSMHVPLQIIPSFPSLNNTADAVVLFDPHGNKMDDMLYDQFTELVEGRSLERIRSELPGSEPGNWAVCVDMNASTPGLENSLHLSSLAPDLQIHLTPNPFTPDGNGQEDQLLIQYDLPIEHGLMTIMIFDMAGRKIAEPVQAKPVGHKGQLVWDGTANYGGIAVTGLYVMKLLVDDQAGRVWKKLQKVYLIR